MPKPCSEEERAIEGDALALSAVLGLLEAVRRGWEVVPLGLSVLEAAAWGAEVGVFALISPLAPEILLVNDEIAQPVQPSVAVVGVPTRGVVTLDVVPEFGACRVSGSVLPYRRMRLKNASNDLLAWSRTTLNGCEQDLMTFTQLPTSPYQSAPDTSPAESSRRNPPRRTDQMTPSKLGEQRCEHVQKDPLKSE